MTSIAGCRAAPATLAGGGLRHFRK